MAKPVRLGRRTWIQNTRLAEAPAKRVGSNYIVLGKENLLHTKVY